MIFCAQKVLKKLILIQLQVEAEDVDGEGFGEGGIGVKILPRQLHHRTLIIKNQPLRKQFIVWGAIFLDYIIHNILMYLSLRKYRQVQYLTRNTALPHIRLINAAVLFHVVDVLIFM